MSTIKRLEAAIVQYVNEKNTDYAVMIDGVWGSGKTFFIKNKLIPELLKSRSELKPIYISLFGVTGSSDLNRKLFLEIFPFLNSKVAKTVGILGKAIISNLGFSGLEKSDQDKLIETVGKIDANTLVVLDDLERLKPDLLVEILGFVNQLVEHNQIKVIISANENDILGTTDTVQLDGYRRYLEKVVRHKLLFTLDFQEIGNEIISSCGLVKDNHNIILEAFRKGESSNLRTLQFVSRMAIHIDDFISKGSIEKSAKQTLKNLAVYFFATMAIDLKAGRMNYIEMKKMVAWSADKPKDFSKIDFNNIEVIDEGFGKKILKEKGTNPQQEYFDRYYSPNQMLYFDSLIEYLRTGYWDERAFDEDVKIAVEYLTTKQNSEAQQLLNQLMNITAVDDHNLNSVIDGVLKHVAVGQYQIGEYIRIYFQIQRIVNDKLIPEPKDLHQQIVSGIDKCKDQEPTHYLEDFIRIDENSEDKFKEVYRLTIDKNNSIKKDKYGKESDVQLRLFFSDPEHYNRKHLAKDGDFIPGFHLSCNPNEFVKKYNELPNHLKVEANGIFYQRQMKGVSRSSQELEWMQKLKEKLVEEIKLSKPTISMVNKQELIRRLDKIINEWEKHKEFLE